MEQQLDQQAGLLLDEALAARGVRCELASGITAIADDAVTLLDGRRIAATRVVIHRRSSTSRWQSQRHLPARGIVVDQQMQTSVPDIYAIGECCEIDGQTFGWSPLSGAGGYSCRAAGRGEHRVVYPDRQWRAP